jgi:cytochrome c oxidase subunit 4
MEGHEMSDHQAQGIEVAHWDGHGAAHVMPLRVLGAVLLALLAFTVITVAVTRVDLGRWNLPIAMVIATVKASLVVLYFMHMRYDRPVNALVFVSALLFVTLFVSLALLDTAAYQPDLIPGYAPAVGK